jgi:glutamine amidotransferase
MNIVIIDYKAGNTRSLQFALSRLGVNAQLSKDAATIQAADGVFFPGVGAAGFAMQQLQESGLDALLPTLKQPVLGICLGMQLLCTASEENAAKGLGVFDATVQALTPAPGLKVPHMGWNVLHNQNSTLLKGLPDAPYFYFVHSYAVPVLPQTTAQCTHGQAFSAMLEQGNFYAVQFHPEKSGYLGAQLLTNFLTLARSPILSY